MWVEVLRQAWFIEFVSSAIHDRLVAGEILERGWGGERPFEGGGAPGILLGGLLAAEETPDKIEEKYSLGGDGEKHRGGHERSNGGTGGSDGG